jgi:hypothetical protein
LCVLCAECLSGLNVRRHSAEQVASGGVSSRDASNSPADDLEEAQAAALPHADAYQAHESPLPAVEPHERAWL